MLGERFKYDAKPQIKLNPLQERIKSQIESKIKNGYYKTEEVPCPICEGQAFETLAEKDRFGLPLSVVICRDCGLIQSNPRMDQASYNKLYSQEYNMLTHGEEKPTKEFFFDRYFFGQKIYRYLKEFFSKNCKDMFVLEVGCSSGGILAYFRDKGCQVLGLDIGEEYVRFGRENYNLDLRTGTFLSCPLERKPDIIIMSHVLEHLLRPQEELNFVKSLLNEKGFVYIEVPGIKNIPHNYYDFNFLNYLRIAHVYHFSLASLENLLNKNGFRLLKGDERIRSISRPGETRSSYISCYHKDLSSLRHFESVRKYMPVTPFKMRNALESSCAWLLRKVRMYALMRKLYRRAIHRIEPKASLKK
ncbi:MAG: hypothetical protein AMJ95_13260 [Omnitrophica WOR_2 bacterium SM23_72]|nr:MAG: hypothetical protein AMJ95_13260 [Omnitrophica WOR_2 bacterium SM23_72]